MTEKTLADKFFDADMEALALQGKLEKALIEAIGIDYEALVDGDIPLPEPFPIPFKQITFDWYDCSFEFKKTRTGWVPTPEMLQTFWNLGFSRCWICYEDGTEQYYSGVRQ